MSADKSKIDALLAEVQSLRDSVQVPDRDEEFREMEVELGRAKYAANVAIEERDAARAELAKVKADIAWTMDKLRIVDLFGLRGSEDIPATGEGYLPFDYDPEDTRRIEWVNAHGRVGAGQSGWHVALPCNIDVDGRIPDPYNVRHIIDLARGVRYSVDGTVEKEVAA